MTEKELRALCDRTVEVAAETMHDAGADLGMIVDRMLTYAIAQMATVDGSPTTAANLRRMAASIEAGAFHKITGEDRARHARH